MATLYMAAPASTKTRIKKIVLQVYPDSGNSYRWRAVAANRKITAASGESFASKGSAQRAAKSFARSLCPDLTKVNIFINVLETSDTKSKVLSTAVIN